MYSQMRSTERSLSLLLFLFFLLLLVRWLEWGKNSSSSIDCIYVWIYIHTYKQDENKTLLTNDKLIVCSLYCTCSVSPSLSLLYHRRLLRYTIMYKTDNSNYDIDDTQIEMYTNSLSLIIHTRSS